jgi:septal ring factor EnvC (AmiA/AmiB activator)
MTNSTESKPPNQWNQLRRKRNNLREREKSLRAELDQLALTLKYVNKQLADMKQPLATTSLRTELERALASRI